MPEREKFSESPHPSGDPQELAKFRRLAEQWWDPKGPSAPLHRLNPVRLGYIQDKAAAHFRLRGDGLPLAGLKTVDVGCGGGLAAEPLAERGADVLGIDLVPESINAARAHAAGKGLALAYRCAGVEDLVAEGATFDLVTCLEVIEHVHDPAAFLRQVTALIRPGGLLVASTLNRTAASLALGKVAAEYILGWVPRGTHDWRKFLKPSELAAPLRHAGLRVTDVTAMNLHPLHGWRLGGPATMNYLLTAVKPADA